MGETPHYKPATRMPTLTWDPKLTKLVAIDVRQCQMSRAKTRVKSRESHTEPLGSKLWKINAIV